MSDYDTASGLISSMLGDVNGYLGTKYTDASEKAQDSFADASAAISALAEIKLEIEKVTALSTPTIFYTPTIISALKTVPDAPDMSYSVPTKPALSTLKDLPSYDTLISSVNSVSNTILSKIGTMLTAGVTGLDATVEALIWARARARQEIKNLAQYTEAEQFFSARGFVIPPGALSGRLQEISVEIGRNDENLNNDITIEQARLAQTNQNFVIEKGAAIAIDLVKIHTEATLKYNENVIKKYEADVERYKQDWAFELGKLEAKVKRYGAEADIYRARAAVATADIEANKAADSIGLALIQANKDLAIKAAEIQLNEAVRVFGLQIEACKLAAQVSGQICASALNAINTSASMVVTGTAQSGTNFGYDQVYSHNENMTV